MSDAELVTYNAPMTNGGALITSYTITVMQDSTIVATFTAVEPSLLSQQLTGLTPGQVYTISVVANNIAGSSVTPATTIFTPPVTLVGRDAFPHGRGLCPCMHATSR